MSDEPINLVTEAHLDDLAAEMEDSIDAAISALRTELEGRIRDLEAEVATLQTQVDGLEDEVAGL